MKKNTDSFIKKIVRQSLNENYNILNEAITLCPNGGFCIGDKNIKYVNSVKGSGGSYIEKFTNLGKLCGTAKMGKPTFSNGTISQYADKLFELLDKTNVDEDQVKNQMIKIGNFPNFCAIKKVFKEHTGVDLMYGGSGFRSVSYGPVDATSNSDWQDLQKYVITPLVDLVNKSLDITKNQKIINSKEEKINTSNKLKKQEELLVTAKKCGYDTIDEYKKANWKCLGPKIIVGGGGANTVNIAQFAPCVVEHPALETENGKPKEYDLPNGKGYKLKTGVPVIDDYVFGVVLVDDNRQEPKKMSTLKQIPIAFDCETDKFIKWSFSNNAWTYNGVFESDGKVALTTDPSKNIDFLSESKGTKGFRYNLLTEAAKVTTTTTTVAAQVTPAFEELSLSKKSKGQKVVDIQTKLGISTKGGFGPQTEKAVKDFQTKYSDKAPTVLGVSDPLRTDGIVDENTYKLIMKFKGASSPKEYGGVTQNYIADNWVKVNPVPGNEDTKLGLNDGIFKITQKLNEYTIVIDCEWDDTIKGGGTTQKLLFGDSSSEGSKTIIKKGDKAAQGDQSIEGGGNVSKGNTNTEVSAEDAEKVRKRKLRNQESCKVMREIKQYLNNTKGLDLPLNCKFTTETKNQVMMALTGGSPAPIQEPGVNVQPVPVTDKLF
jgi:peptidoglycan hydrolase-like protein with peptidoglycan-binding domain